MKYSLQFSDAIHILAYIEIFQDSNLLSSEMIAKVSKLAQQMSENHEQTKKSGLIIITQNGKAAPSLARKPEKITLFDVYQSIEGNTNLIQVDPKPTQIVWWAPISKKL